MRDVLVLERRFLASGGTGRSVGVMRQLYPTDSSSRMVLHSLRVFQSFGEITGGGDAGYVQCGALLGGRRGQRARSRERVEAQRGLGIDTRLIGPDDVRELDPRIDPFAVGAAVWEPESGYGDPTGVTAGFRARGRARRRRHRAGGGGRRLEVARRRGRGGAPRERRPHRRARRGERRRPVVAGGRSARRA